MVNIICNIAVAIGLICVALNATKKVSIPRWIVKVILLGGVLVYAVNFLYHGH